MSAIRGWRRAVRRANNHMSKKIYNIPTYRIQLVRDGQIKARTITRAVDVIKATIADV